MSYNKEPRKSGDIFLGTMDTITTVILVIIGISLLLLFGKYFLILGGLVGLMLFIMNQTTK